MSRTTIDFGIDLGTTNSAIAYLDGTEPKIIKNSDQSDTTPSAVFIDKKAQLYVGRRARNALTDERKALDAYDEFKRRMGTEYCYRFAASGREMSPEALSAEVLKSLRADCTQAVGEEPNATVITVPAAFEQRQCVATMEAAEMAGLSQAPLLQEPVAAALAHGFQIGDEKRYWFVFDFGGGTFDAAIIRAEDGAIRVVNHGGDNHLGGANIDRALLDDLVIPQLLKAYNLPDFNRSNPKWAVAFAKLKKAAEEAKIILSRRDTALFEMASPFEDADGEEVEADIEITRSSLASLAEPIMDKAASISLDIMKEKGLGAEDFEKVILVGGPTLSPYFREYLEDRLHSALDFSIDPMTVVAQGAAIFAGTQRLAVHQTPGSSGAAFDVDLKYDPVGPDDDPLVRGKVSSNQDSSLEGFAIEIVNTDSLWQSGKVALDKRGVFSIRLVAEKEVRNNYAIKLTDASGSSATISPDSLTYTIGVTIDEQSLPVSVGVALADNSYWRALPKGQALPARAMRSFKTIESIHRNSSGVLLRIPIVEGEEDLADLNRLQGSITIPADAISRDLPAHSEVEVTLVCNESRQLQAEAYVPMLDQDFSASIEPSKAAPSSQELENEIRRTQERLEEMGDSVDGSSKAELHNALRRLVDEVEGAGGRDHEKLTEADVELLELKRKIESHAEGSEWITLERETRNLLTEMRSLVEAQGSPENKAEFTRLQSQFESAVADQRAVPVRECQDGLRNLGASIVQNLPEIWILQFQLLQSERDKMKDPQAAEQLLQEGYGAVKNNDIGKLQGVVIRLMQLLPETEAKKIQEKRGYGSGLGM